MTVQELERGFHGMSLDHGQVGGFEVTSSYEKFKTCLQGF